MTPGNVYFAFDQASHVIVEAGQPPRLRTPTRDPVGGIRPCADLLFGSVARAKLPAHAGLLSGSGADGAKGLQILMQTGGKVFLEDPAEGAPRDRMNAVHACCWCGDEAMLALLLEYDEPPHGLKLLDLQ